jgi:hypothetical protein
MRNFGYLSRLERLEEFASAVVIEQRVRGLDAQKETVPACQGETGHVE